MTNLLSSTNNDMPDSLTIFGKSLCEAIFKQLHLLDYNQSTEFEITNIDKLTGYNMTDSVDKDVFTVIKLIKSIIKEIPGIDKNGKEYIDVAPLFPRLRFYPKNKKIEGEINIEVLQYVRSISELNKRLQENDKLEH